MSESRSELMRLDNFVGEHRHLPEHRLGSRVSPSALNIDYVDGAMQPRPGMTRLHSDAVLGGGMLLTRMWKGSGSAVGHSWSGVITYECMAGMLWYSGSKKRWAFWHASGDPTLDTAPTDGVAVALSGTTVHAYIGYSGSVTHLTRTMTLSGGSEQWASPALAIMVVINGTSVSLTVNGSTTSATLGGSFTPAGTLGTAVLAVGDTMASTPASAPTAFVEIDELRIWDGTQAQSLQTERRELLSSEKTGALIGYWQFHSSQLSYSGSYQRVEDQQGTTHLVCEEISDRNAGINPFRVARGMVTGTANYEEVSGLAVGLGHTPPDEMIVASASGLWVYANGGSTLTPVHPALFRGLGRWAACGFEGWTILCNGTVPNLRYQSGKGMLPLSYPAPVTRTPSAPTCAATGGLAAGTYYWAFAYVDGTGVQSAIGSWTPSASASAGDEATFADLLEQARADVVTQNIMGVQALRVFRTKADGGDFYLVEDVDIALWFAGSYVDDTADADLIELMDDKWGQAPNGKTVFVHKGHLFVACGSALYISEAGRVGGFFSENVLSVGADDGDIILASAVTDGAAYVFKANGIWEVTGDGLATFGIRPIQQDLGCVSQATIAAGRGGIYFLSRYGPAVLSGGQGDVIAADADRALFEAVTESGWDYCSGMYDRARARYVVTIPGSASNPGHGSKLTVVAPEGTAQDGTVGPAGVVWEWDLEAEYWLRKALSGGASQVYAGFRGYLCTFSGRCDGGLLAGSGWATVEGAVTGGSSTTLAASGASFPTTGTGLGGLPVTLLRANGTFETRYVWRNDGTTLYLTSAWSGAAPTTGDIYYVGGIAVVWRSARLAPGGHWTRDAVLLRYWVLTDGAGTDTIAFWATGEDLNTAESAPDGVDTSDRVTEIACRTTRGREITFGLGARSATKTWRIEAIEAMWSDRGARP